MCRYIYLSTYFHDLREMIILSYHFVYIFISYTVKKNDFIRSNMVIFVIELFGKIIGNPRWNR
ncbi:hypothetical protein BCF58_1718 [Chryseobacterium defluvii]|uniref:Uncharacterized protein n=1 Tax=Chryseobacterium defluvii TaxID=160396 RepID=A0A495SC70_9FLAO|nr:hypothetical protein BCF58_1718 [Chryseobacterium defluvii]